MIQTRLLGHCIYFFSCLISFRCIYFFIVWNQFHRLCKTEDPLSPCFIFATKILILSCLSFFLWVLFSTHTKKDTYIWKTWFFKTRCKYYNDHQDGQSTWIRHAWICIVYSISIHSTHHVFFIEVADDAGKKDTGDSIDRGHFTKNLV